MHNSFVPPFPFRQEQGGAPPGAEAEDSMQQGWARPKALAPRWAGSSSIPPWCCACLLYTSPSPRDRG
eukprot:2262494-Rhodomonas_salina.2